jgi:hypothetical protein
VAGGTDHCGCEGAVVLEQDFFVHHFVGAYRSLRGCKKSGVILEGFMELRGFLLRLVGNLIFIIYELFMVF